MTESSITLKLEGVSKSFHTGTLNEVRPLQKIHLQVPKGSFIVLLGGNGSGKSTLLNAIAGSCPIDDGKIEINGLDVTPFPEHRRAKDIGRVFQNPFAGTAPSMTIAENLSIAMQRGHRRGFSWSTSKSRRKDFHHRLQSLKMGLELRLDTPIGTLSGGQRQALTLLMATWNQPKVLLLDEHTAALDPKSAERVLELTRDLVLEHHLTTLMVTHSLTQALNFGNRILVMDQGQILHDFNEKEKEALKLQDLLLLFGIETESKPPLR